MKLFWNSEFLIRICFIFSSPERISINLFKCLNEINNYFRKRKIESWINFGCLLIPVQIPYLVSRNVPTKLLDKKFAWFGFFQIFECISAEDISIEKF